MKIYTPMREISPQRPCGELFGASYKKSLGLLRPRHIVLINLLSHAFNDSVGLRQSDLCPKLSEVFVLDAIFVRILPTS